MIRKQRLDNGITLLSESMPQVRSICIGVWLRRGSRNERATVNGISHFIEHLVFKGTRSRSARQIALEMDAVGGQMDAFTAKEYTCFFAKVLDEHLPAAVDLLADIVQRPLFDPTELERERGVVLEEIRMVEDTPDDLVYDLFNEAFYPDHALGRPIQGTVDSVAALSRRQLMSFFRKSYSPDNIIVAAAGNLKHARTRKLVERAFAELEAEPPRKQRRESKPRSRTHVTLRRKRSLEQLHLLLGVPAFVPEVEQRYPLYVLNAILGGTMSSRLFQSIREERGLAYSVYSALQLFRDTGVLNVYCGTSPDRGLEVVELVANELRQLRDDGPREDELRVARENLKGSLMLGLESTSSRMSNLARQEIYLERQIGLNATLKGLERVDAQAVREAAGEIFNDVTMSAAAVGRVPNANKLERRLTL